MTPPLKNIPLIIGRLSGSEEHIINMATLPHLFISHSHDVQLPELFTSFIEQMLRGNTGALFALSLSSRMAEQIMPSLPRDLVFIEFLHADTRDGTISSIDEFVKALMAELKKRKTFYKRPAAKGRMPAILVFVDDIFEVIISANKKTPLAFIELLISAAAYDMFFLMGSSGIYRNLLNRLINITPALKKKLNKELQEQHISQPLGAELVMNPDGLIFFREKGEKIHRRLYPLVAGENL